MKPVVWFPLFLLLYIIPLIGTREAEAAQLTFELYAVGLHVAESNMNLELTPTTYRMGLRYHTTGVASLMTADTLDQSVSGTFAGDQPVPREFKSFIRLHSQDRVVILDYHDGNPVETTISPPNAVEREIVPPPRREHTLDPLSATLDMLHLAAETGRCDLRQTTYDGRRLEIFQAQTGGEENIPPSNRSIFSGRALRCDYTSQPIAGLRLGDERNDDARVRKGTIWLGQLVPGGPRLPVQALVDVRFLGAATMYLTADIP